MLILPKSDSHYVVPPVNLGFLATALRNVGHEVTIIDGIKDKLTTERLKKELELQQPSLIGISMFSCDIPIVREYVRAIQEWPPNCTIVLGGPHVSGVGSKIFKDLPDTTFYAIQGEAELSLPMFLNGEDYAKIPGFIWKEGNKEYSNPSYFEDDLDKLGLPAWDLMDPRTYPTAPQGAVFRNYPIAPIIASRGCPYQCTYCGSKVATGRKFRKRSLASILTEVELLYNKYGVREIHIIDDTFTLDRERVIGFCNAVADMGISYTFPNGVRLNTLDEDLLVLLKNSGCYAMSVGIESGSQRILDDMKKGLTLELIEEKTMLADRIGIDVNGFFIVGYPTETRETILETIRFAKKLPIKRAHFSCFLPLPGTEITDQLIKEGKIKDPDWAKLAYSEVPFVPDGMTKDELKSLQRRAFMEFYGRPRIAYGLLREIRTWTHFKYLAKRAKDYAFGG